MRSNEVGFECPDEAATVAFAGRLADVLEGGDVLILEGDLGAGKTFLVRALARRLGLEEHVPVTSPTFALVHEYPEASPQLLHADLYRLGDADELTFLGLEDKIGAPDWVCAIEWGERFLDAIAEADAIVRLSVTGPSARAIAIVPVSERGAAIASALE